MSGITPKKFKDLNPEEQQFMRYVTSEVVIHDDISEYSISDDASVPDFFEKVKERSPETYRRISTNPLFARFVPASNIPAQAAKVPEDFFRAAMIHTEKVLMQFPALEGGAPNRYGFVPLFVAAVPKEKYSIGIFVSRSKLEVGVFKGSIPSPYLFPHSVPVTKLRPFRQIHSIPADETDIPASEIWGWEHKEKKGTIVGFMPERNFLRVMRKTSMIDDLRTPGTKVPFFETTDKIPYSLFQPHETLLEGDWLDYYPSSHSTYDHVVESSNTRQIIFRHKNLRVVIMLDKVKKTIVQFSIIPTETLRNAAEFTIQDFMAHGPGILFEKDRKIEFIPLPRELEKIIRENKAKGIKPRIEKVEDVEVEAPLKLTKSEVNSLIATYPYLKEEILAAAKKIQWGELRKFYDLDLRCLFYFVDIIQGVPHHFYLHIVRIKNEVSIQATLRHSLTDKKTNLYEFQRKESGIAVGWMAGDKKKDHALKYYRIQPSGIAPSDDFSNVQGLLNAEIKSFEDYGLRASFLDPSYFSYYPNEESPSLKWNGSTHRSLYLNMSGTAFFLRVLQNLKENKIEGVFLWKEETKSWIHLSPENYIIHSNSIIVDHESVPLEYFNFDKDFFTQLNKNKETNIQPTLPVLKALALEKELESKRQEQEEADRAARNQAHLEKNELNKNISDLISKWNSQYITLRILRLSGFSSSIKLGPENFFQMRTYRSEENNVSLMPVGLSISISADENKKIKNVWDGLAQMNEKGGAIWLRIGKKGDSLKFTFYKSERDGVARFQSPELGIVSLYFDETHKNKKELLVQLLEHENKVTPWLNENVNGPKVDVKKENNQIKIWVYNKATSPFADSILKQIESLENSGLHADVSRIHDTPGFVATLDCSNLTVEQFQAVYSVLSEIHKIYAENRKVYQARAADIFYKNPYASVKIKAPKPIELPPSETLGKTNGNEPPPNIVGSAENVPPPVINEDGSETHNEGEAGGIQDLNEAPIEAPFTPQVLFEIEDRDDCYELVYLNFDGKEVSEKRFKLKLQEKNGSREALFIIDFKDDAERKIFADLHGNPGKFDLKKHDGLALLAPLKKRTDDKMIYDVAAGRFIPYKKDAQGRLPFLLTWLNEAQMAGFKSAAASVTVGSVPSSTGDGRDFSITTLISRAKRKWDMRAGDVFALTDDSLLWLLGKFHTVTPLTGAPYKRGEEVEQPLVFENDRGQRWSIRVKWNGREQNPFDIDLEKKDAVTYYYGSRPTDVENLSDKAWVYNQRGKWNFYSLGLVDGVHVKLYNMRLVFDPASPVLFTLYNSLNEFGDEDPANALRAKVETRARISAIAQGIPNISPAIFLGDIKLKITEGKKVALSYVSEANSSDAELSGFILEGVDVAFSANRVSLDQEELILKIGSQEIKLKASQGPLPFTILLSPVEEGYKPYIWNMEHDIIVEVPHSLESLNDEDLKEFLISKGFPISKTSSTSGTKPANTDNSIFVNTNKSSEKISLKLLVDGRHPFESIPVLPKKLRSVPLPDLKEVRLASEDEVSILLEKYFPSGIGVKANEETLLEQILTDHKDDVQRFVTRDGVILEFIVQENSDPNSVYALEGGRIFFPDNEKGKFVEIPHLILHARSLGGKEYYIEVQIGERKFAFQRLSTSSTYSGREATSYFLTEKIGGQKKFLPNYRSLMACIQYMGLGEKNEPIISKLGEKYLMDYRYEGSSLIIEGIESEIIDGEKYFTLERVDGKKLIVYRPEVDRAENTWFYTYDSETEEMNYIHIDISKGEPEIHERRRPVQIDRYLTPEKAAPFPSYKIEGEEYTSQEKSLMIRSQRNDGWTEILGILGRWEGADEFDFSEDNVNSSFRFRVLMRFNEAGELEYKWGEPTEIEKKYGVKMGMSAEAELQIAEEYDDEGPGRTYIAMKEKEGIGKAYAWLEFNSFENLMGENFQPSGAHLLLEKGGPRRLMPSDPQFHTHRSGINRSNFLINRPKNLLLRKKL